VRSRLRRLFGGILGAIVRIWVATLRVRIEVHQAASTITARRVLAFFHGQQMALLGARGARCTAVLVSHSADGEIQAGVMRSLGFAVLRGSSSHGGASGLRALLRVLSSSIDAAFAVDGPRGPLGVAKPGAAYAARAAGAVLLPVASASRRAWVLERTWDKFEIPLPFSRVAVVVGPPLSGSDGDDVGGAIRAARNRAQALVSAE
jgi:lysophospholipid acyltransferase (LPLAT)-like uncharacterized protein